MGDDISPFDTRDDGALLDSRRLLKTVCVNAYVVREIKKIERYNLERERRGRKPVDQGQYVAWRLWLGAPGLRVLALEAGI